ncbi:hypothetical protein K0M31_005383, partial [Melipona bicolor]
DNQELPNSQRKHGETQLLWRYFDTEWQWQLPVPKASRRKKRAGRSSDRAPYASFRWTAFSPHHRNHVIKFAETFEGSPGREGITLG